ncbi:ATP-dependent helicase [Nocardia carnea]|uniref:ATP-dependent helicase n=1 Tax=Nocardia carnea TaxID=37328 RepID=UPI0024553149|nr:ATP-dependent helicase [Nocardia carnea]
MSEDTYLHSHDLTDEQQAVVEQPWDACVLVTAGAGSGKTHTLVRRLDRLMVRDEISAGDILVLTFSRAAVRELARRIAGFAQSARRIRVQTFDAWATSLLVEIDAEGEWQHQPFDDRIKVAIEAIERGYADDWYADDLRHILVDEVQDLVGLRREMVEALIERFPGAGVTVVGDSAQAIYGFQVRDEVARAAEANRFFSWLREHFGPELVELSLTRNFRARTLEARRALAFGSAVGALRSNTDEDRTAAAQVYRGLSEELSISPAIGDMNDGFTTDALRDYPDTCAILTRNNGQALLLSERLRESGVPHSLRRTVTDRPSPGWLADLFDQAERSTITEDEVKEFAAGRLGADPAQAQEIWRALRSLERRRVPGAVSYDSIRRAIWERRIPDELVPQPTERLTVSTIHRAKGLEFDRVIVLRERDYRRSEETAPADDARLLYVALTRARDDLYQLEEVNSGVQIARRDDRIRRWYIGDKRKNRRLYRGGLEAVGNEVDSRKPPGTEDFVADPVRIQGYLRDNLRSGESVEFRVQDDDMLWEETSPPYVLYHGEQPIGTASETFRVHLLRLLKHGKTFEVRRWPCRIRGLSVEVVESVAGSPVVTQRAGLGETGVWRIPRLCGLGRFDWKGKAEVDDDNEA